MEIVPEHASAELPRGDVFTGLNPRSLIVRKREDLKKLYDDFKKTGWAPEVQKDVEKLWVVFDLALETDNAEFVVHYLDAVCFSPELIRFGPDAYYHSIHVVLDWCQKFHSDAEMQILQSPNDAQSRLPRKCDQIRHIMDHCRSHRGGDPERKQQRNDLIQKSLHTTNGIKLAALAASWSRSSYCSVLERMDHHLPTLASDSYLASQSLPPLWLEHYPFQDVAKMMEIVFLNKEYLGNEDLRYSKLAMLGFFLLHSGRVTSLEFLTERFDVEHAVAVLWQGLFLIDLCSFDRRFQSKDVLDEAVRSLEEASLLLKRPLPLETLHKLQSFGYGSEVKQMFMMHLTTYLRLLSSHTVAVANQGLAFCLSSGDVSSGLTILRETIQRLCTVSDGVSLLRHFFDQILGAVRLEDLVMQKLTGLEEAVFIDWAGNKKDDPECSFYLALYFLRCSNMDGARRLYELSKDTMQHSVHKELWSEIGQILHGAPVPQFDRTSSQKIAEESVSMEATVEDEQEEEMAEAEGVAELIDGSRGAIPWHIHHLLKQSQQSGAQMLRTYSESLFSYSLCPLRPTKEELASLHPSLSDRENSEPSLQGAFVSNSGSAAASDRDEFYDAVESL